MAVPGETVCHEPQSCGTGTWGDIPVDATTQYVDASYTGGGSDGTVAKPWMTIADGLSHAGTGAVVAVAQGSYMETLTIAKGVKLWGVCPSKVSVIGGAADSAAVSVNAMPPEQTVEVHGLGITGPGDGVYVNGADGVTLAGLWVHDTGGESRGIHLVDGAQHAVVTLRDSLIEAAHRQGLYAEGSETTIQNSEIRGTLPKTSDGSLGRGIAVDDSNGKKGTLNLSGALLDQNHDVGLLVRGSEATVDGTVIRNTQPQASDHMFGRGIEVSDDNGQRSTLTLTGSQLDNNHDSGLFVVGSDATVKGSVIQNTQVQVSDHSFGDAFCVFGQAAVQVETSLLQNSARASVSNFGATVTLTEVEAVCSPILFDQETNYTDPATGSVQEYGEASYQPDQLACVACDGSALKCKVVSQNLEPPQSVDALEPSQPSQ